MSVLREAYCGAYEALVSWCDLLDRINVYPVADADTGTNLRISLSPLRNLQKDKIKLIDQLSCSAIGNSGNIAAAFFKEFLLAETFAELPVAAQRGRDTAWESVLEPKSGTMLTVFDSLAETLNSTEVSQESAPDLIGKNLQNAVLSTTQILPSLEQAGVVDSGALGMFVFLDVFFQILAGKKKIACPVTELFQGKLTIADSFESEMTGSYCVDTIIDTQKSLTESIEKISTLGDSVVVVPEQSHLKVHIHTDNPETLRRKLSSIGCIVQWSDEAIDTAKRPYSSALTSAQAIHIVTDAAGSISREAAESLGITLLDSYIIAGNESRPESLFSAAEIYSLLQNGVKVSTGQASIFERHQHYSSLLEQYESVLYLCVGSVYTGNFETVTAWKRDNDPENRLQVLDSGTASGKLGVIAMITARYAAATKSPDAVVHFAQQAIDTCEEYIFIDQLKYLAAGGRLSKTNSFFGDLLRMKPVVVPSKDGARKVGVVRNQAAQVEFAMDRLNSKLNRDSSGLIMLQYSDNKEWVDVVMKQTIQHMFPQIEVITMPLSLTSGVHMGPGTWAVAFMPDWRDCASS